MPTHDKGSHIYKTEILHIYVHPNKKNSERNLKEKKMSLFCSCNMYKVFRLFDMFKAIDRGAQKILDTQIFSIH